MASLRVRFTANWFLTCGVCLLVCCGHELFAQTNIHLELGSRGTASVTFNLRLPAGSTSGDQKDSQTTVLTIVLPFQLEEGYRVSKPDDVELAVLSNRDNYAILGLISTTASTQTSFRIDNAFRLSDEGLHGRVKFACDISFKNLKQHRSILNLPSTISKYDITISLPQEYRREELSFEPQLDKWTADEAGRVYTLHTSATDAKGAIWIAFPSPFKGGLQSAQIVLSVIFGLALLILEGKLAIGRTLGPMMLLIALIVSLGAILAAGYFVFTLADAREFLAWAAGPLVPVVIAPFACVWLLMRPQFEAEMQGSITLDEGFPSFVQASVTKKNLKSGKTSTQRVSLKDDGTYHTFVWCGRSKIAAHITAAGGAGTSEEKSGEYQLSPKTQIAVPVINVKRAEVRQTTAPVTGKA